MPSHFRRFLSASKHRMASIGSCWSSIPTSYNSGLVCTSSHYCCENYDFISSCNRMIMRGLLIVHSLSHALYWWFASFFVPLKRSEKNKEIKNSWKENSQELDSFEIIGNQSLETVKIAVLKHAKVLIYSQCILRFKFRWIVKIHLITAFSAKMKRQWSLLNTTYVNLKQQRNRRAFFSGKMTSLPISI